MDLPELNGYSKQQVAQSLSPRHLELILLPTEKCNFRCSYCYESFELGRMPRHVIDGVKNLISRRSPAIDSLTLSWFGGEPLLQQAVCHEIASHAYSESKNHGFRLNGGFTTNGYLLTPHLVKKFAEVNHTDYQITLDGDRKHHDGTRKLANGHGTFSKIWNALCDLKETSLEYKITLRIHISPGNIDSVESLLFRIEESFGQDHRYSIHFHRVTDLGGPNSGQFLTLSNDSYKATLAKIRSSSNITLPSDSELDMIENHGICYAAKANSLLVRSNGRLGKCTVAFDDDRNDIGHINPDGTIEVNQQRWRLWLEGFETMDHDFLGCPYSKLSQITSQKKGIDIIVSA